MLNTFIFDSLGEGKRWQTALFWQFYSVFFLFAIKGISHKQSSTSEWGKLANLQGRKNCGMFFHANPLISTANLEQVCQFQCVHPCLFMEGSSSVLLTNTSLSLPSSSLLLWNSAAALVGPVPIKGLVWCFFEITKNVWYVIWMWCPSQAGAWPGAQVHAGPVLAPASAHGFPCSSPNLPDTRIVQADPYPQLPARRFIYLCLRVHINSKSSNKLCSFLCHSLLNTLVMI